MPRKDGIGGGTGYNRSPLGQITETGSRGGCARATEPPLPPFARLGKETGAPLRLPPFQRGSEAFGHPRSRVLDSFGSRSKSIEAAPLPVAVAGTSPGMADAGGRWTAGRRSLDGGDKAKPPDPGAGRR